jgi:cytosine/adenosine deaminase-related metal-dependent hydrolase
MEEIDLIVGGGLTVTMDPARRVLANGAVAVDRCRIRDVGPAAEIARRYRARQTIDATDFVVLPGLVDAHVHIGAEHLTRGSYRGDPGHEWLLRWAAPVYGAITPEEEHVAAQLSCIEMLRNGTTTFGEGGSVVHMAAVAEAVLASGLRGVLAPWCWDRTDGPAAFRKDAARNLDDLDRCLAILKGYGSDRLIGAASCISPVFCSPALLAGLTAIARSRGITLHFHHGGSRTTVDAYADRLGKRPVEHFEELGLLAPNTRMSHMVHLDAREIAILARTGATVTFCPQTALRLAYGATQAGRVPELVAAGVNVSLGTDGVNSSDNQDMFKALQLVVGLFADAREDTAILSAEQALEMATIKGAEALGLADEVGSLEPGKSADLILVDRRSPELTPLLDVANALVHACDGRLVDTTIICGRVVMQGRRIAGLDEAAVYGKARRMAGPLMERAGIAARPGWPVLPGQVTGPGPDRAPPGRR